VTPLTQRNSTFRQDKEAQACRRKRTNTGSGLIQVFERREKKGTVKNQPSLSEEQQGAASPSDYEENKQTGPLCQEQGGSDG